MLIKSFDEIKQIKKGGKILGRILAKLKKKCRHGASTWEVDQMAERMIIEAGGKPSFKGYKNNPNDPPFPSTICMPINHELVHAAAKKDVFLKNGDIFSIDIGMEWPTVGNPDSRKECGYFTDTAVTFAIGEVSEEVKKLLSVTRAALEVGIKAAKPYKTVADIGRAIESYVSSQGNYGIVRDLVGHGVGHDVHEEPRIPNFYEKASEKWVLKPGMVIAIEPMVALGGHEVHTAQDGWAIEMSDGSLCAHFEHTVIITKTGNEVATRRPGEKSEK